MAIITPVASFKTTLTQKLSAAGTTAFIDTTTDDSGNDLDGKIIAVTLEKGVSGKEETVIGTVSTSGASMTSLTRNIDVLDGTTAGTGVTHRKKSTVEITAFPYLTLALRALNGTDQLAAASKMAYDGAVTHVVGSNELATIKYADDLAIAGAPDSSATTKGLNEMATSAESQAGTDTGSTTGPLVVAPSDIAANVQNQSHVYLADSGAADAYVITLVPAVTAYAAGQRFTFLATNACTGASTLNVNGLGVKDIKKSENGTVAAALANNDILAAQIVTVVYDGTQFLMDSPLGTRMTSATNFEAQTFFASTDISAAEAETLTDGSDASALHSHTSKNGTTTKNAADASVTQNIAHGFGAVPNRVRIKGIMYTGGSGAGDTNTYIAETVYNGTTQSSISIYGTNNTVPALAATTFTLNASATTGTQTGVVTLDATNIIITWTKASSPSGTYNLLWEVE